MNRKNRFGVEPVNPAEVPSRKRDVGPMGAAVREAADSLSASTENLVEQRRQNAADAKLLRAAQIEGRILEMLPTDVVRFDDLPRDRMDLGSVANSEEMEELKASIRERGQKEPIEVYRTNKGYQLKKGWRRLTALNQLRHETGDDRFDVVLARVVEGSVSRIDLYIDMVEENVIREDLTFSEMAQVAISAAKDLASEGHSAEDLVGRIFASLHKMKRSYIRSFVFLLEQLGEAVRYPKLISRNVGVEVSRMLQSSPDLLPQLRTALLEIQTPEQQAETFQHFLAGSISSPKSVSTERGKSMKYEFRVGKAKVTARKGECRILSDDDFLSVDRRRLQLAIEAFQHVLRGE